MDIPDNPNHAGRVRGLAVCVARVLADDDLLAGRRHFDGVRDVHGRSEMMMMINANNFDSYEQARDVYLNVIVSKYGATRLDWGFGRWLFLSWDKTLTSDELEYWVTLDRLGILTNDGARRLAKAKKAAQK